MPRTDWEKKQNRLIELQKLQKDTSKYSDILLTEFCPLNTSQVIDSKADKEVLAKRDKLATTGLFGIQCQQWKQRHPEVRFINVCLYYFPFLLMIRA